MIDSDKLPGRVLIDTSTVVLALGERTDNDAIICRELWKELLRRNCEILIAAPSLAEMVRNGGSPPPRSKQITVVAFDAAAATIVGERLPHRLIQQLDRNGAPADYFKFDTLIVACAIRHRAHMLITRDRGQRIIAAEAQFPSAHPGEYVMPVFKAMVPVGALSPLPANVSYRKATPPP